EHQLVVAALLAGPQCLATGIPRGCGYGALCTRLRRLDARRILPGGWILPTRDGLPGAGGLVRGRVSPVPGVAGGRNGHYLRLLASRRARAGSACAARGSGPPRAASRPGTHVRPVDESLRPVAAPVNPQSRT